MREVIEKRLRGQFEYDTGSLTFSEQRLELTIPEGKDAEGSFMVYGPTDRVVEGVVSSTELRMSVLTPSFSGAHDTISYHFHADGLKGGDVLQGYFRIISNRGEYQLPFVVSVEIHHMDSSLGDIRNLFHFANLARTNYNEAVKLFYDPRFEKILSGNDAQYLGLYRGLSAVKNNEQNVEEFLLAVNKKQKTEYLPDRKEIELNNPYGDQEFLIHISRNGWGYTFLKVETDADFIVLSDDKITENDFLNNSVSYRFTVKYEKLHVGSNFTKVRFYNAFTSFDVVVTVTSPTLTSAERDAQHDLYKLTRLYEEFRLKKIGMERWLRETDAVLTRMTALTPDDFTLKLYRAHYLLTADRVNEGKWILEQSSVDADQCGDNRLKAYHAYLKVLADLPDTSIDETVKEVRLLLSDTPTDWRMNWLLLYLSDEYSVSSVKKQHLLQDLYDAGCRSPFVYIEALQMMNAQPSALKQLNPFSVSVLRYGARHNAIEAPLREQALLMADREKVVSKDLFRILKAIDDAEQSEGSLRSICEALIRMERTDAEAFSYYERGVAAQLKTTRLYEYYMMSMPVDANGAIKREIPRAVLMYYTYQSNLSHEKSAALYRYVYDKRAELPELYEAYEEKMRIFLSDQVSRRRSSENLGILYRALFTREMTDSDNAHALLQVLYTAKIKVNDKKADRVVVRYHRLQEEREYFIQNGEAYVPLYGSEYTILLLDRDDNRYSVSIPHEIVKLMLPGALVTYAMPYLTEGKPVLDLFLTEQGKGSLRVEEENLNRYMLLADSIALTEEARLEIKTALLRFYYEKDYIPRLAQALEEIRPETLSTKTRGDVLDMMILAGMYERALSWIKSYGTFDVDPKTIVRLYSRMADNEMLGQSSAETEIAYYAFRKGKYDERLLTYLTGHFTGLVREMRDIWKASAGFSIDTYKICERIIVQMLYSGAYIGDRMHVFRDYVNRTGNAEVEIAFLSQCAYDCFVKDRVMEEYIFERIAKQYKEGSRLDKVCKLAYLKHFAENKSGVQPDKEVVREFLMHLTREKMFFSFYQDYADALPQMVAYADKTIVEYKTRPGNRCVLHFLDAEDNEDDVYKSVAMKEQYDGIYVASFTLFFGEQMQYYITEASSVKEEVTESGTITKNDIAQTMQAGRFNLINDIMIGEALHDYETVDRLLEEYFRKQFIATKLFRPYKSKKEKEAEERTQE